MAIIKAYTDLKQSKKLAEILPIESADMYYQYVLPKSDKIKHIPEIGNPVDSLEWYNKGYTHFGKEPLSLKEYCIPCWSLAALLRVLVYPELREQYNGNWTCKVSSVEKTYLWEDDNLVDACYEMILKLHEQKLL